MASPSEWPVLPLATFPVYSADDQGDLRLDVLAEVGPTGCFRDFRVTVGGKTQLEVNFSTSGIFNSPMLPASRLTMNVKAGDLVFPRNSLTSHWMDVSELVRARELDVTYDNDTEEDYTEDFLETLSSLVDDSAASLRWAIDCRDQGIPYLVLQGLPFTADILNDNPAFSG
jgi:hypothetical protein